MHILSKKFMYCSIMASLATVGSGVSTSARAHDMSLEKKGDQSVMTEAEQDAKTWSADLINTNLIGSAESTAAQAAKSLVGLYEGKTGDAALGVDEQKRKHMATLASTHNVISAVSGDTPVGHVTLTDVGDVERRLANPPAYFDNVSLLAAKASDDEQAEILKDALVQGLGMRTEESDDIGEE